MLKKKKFYNDGERNLLYLGEERSFQNFHDNTKFSKFIYYNSDKNRESMGVLKIPTERISDNGKRLNMPKDLLCMHIIVYPNLDPFKFNFKQLKKVYDSALEKELQK